MRRREIKEIKTEMERDRENGEERERDCGGCGERKSS